ncbi:MAG: SurA N-terminal domain-containing protein [Nitrospiraceae bacterium]|nr:SurA N-terminal domain-containing protein [Nitrospiraceae bacterium]
MKKVLVLILGIFILVGCSKDGSKKNPVLAKVDGSAITKEDLSRELEALPVFAQKMFDGEEGKSRLIDEIVKKELLYKEAKKKGLDKDPAYAKKIADTQKLILISTLLEKEIDSKVNVSEQEIKDFYDKNKANIKDKSGRQYKFEEVKGYLTQQISSQKQKEAFDAYIENLKKTYKVEINKQAIADISKPAESKKDNKKEPIKEQPKK